MKQQIIELKKKLMLVERDSAFSQEWMDVFSKHKLIGKLADIKEEQFKELVKENDELSLAGCGFEDYDGTSICDTAKESFFSKLEVDRVFFENKLPDPELTMRQGDGSIYYGASEKEFKDFQEAEEKIWNLSRTYLFEIIINIQS